MPVACWTDISSACFYNFKTLEERIMSFKNLRSVILATKNVSHEYRKKVSILRVSQILRKQINVSDTGKSMGCTGTITKHWVLNGLYTWFESSIPGNSKWFTFSLLKILKPVFVVLLNRLHSDTFIGWPTAELIKALLWAVSQNASKPH